MMQEVANGWRLWRLSDDILYAAFQPRPWRTTSMAAQCYCFDEYHPTYRARGEQPGKDCGAGIYAFPARDLAVFEGHRTKALEPSGEFVLGQVELVGGIRRRWNPEYGGIEIDGLVGTMKGIHLVADWLTRPADEAVAVLRARYPVPVNTWWLPDPAVRECLENLRANDLDYLVASRWKPPWQELFTRTTGPDPFGP
jgi:hypothetical protein